MLIESYTFEAVWSIATAISNFLNNPSSALLAAGDPTTKVGSLSYSGVTFNNTSPASRPFLTFLSFTVSQRGGDGPQRQGASSRACNGTTMFGPPLIKSVASILKCLQLYLWWQYVRQQFPSPSLPCSQCTFILGFLFYRGSAGANSEGRSSCSFFLTKIFLIENHEGEMCWRIVLDNDLHKVERTRRQVRHVSSM